MYMVYPNSVDQPAERKIDHSDLTSHCLCLIPPGSQHLACVHLGSFAKYEHKLSPVGLPVRCL